jgi:DNA (cytosine-5)-methyltransferase 1
LTHKYVIQSIKANYDPDIIFGDPDGPYPDGDITKRDIKDVPDIDLYVCGFPCQTFSQAGKRQGFEDKRGNVFWSCLEVIKYKEPKIFILENVKGLLSHEKGNTFSVILKSLEQLENFTVFYKLLNTKDYGIPQNRQRIFFVGIRIDVQEEPYEFPIKKSMKSLGQFIDTTNTKRLKWLRKTTLDGIPKDSVFIDVDFLYYTKYPDSGKVSPCLMARCSLWCVPIHRYATVLEYLMLQGFTVDFKKVISITQMKKQIGNSMSVNVLKEIMLCVAKATNPTTQKNLSTTCLG